ncbi:MAG: lamin tail domain-containing protein, partial [Verrucomicrobiales bacterium]|nr:lamin tail domain-containing protein [Verrucomicrobiales bacterium]
MLKIIAPFAAAALAAVLVSPASKGDILVDLDATSLPLGNRSSWTNAGTIGGTFSAEIDTPIVQNVSGVRALTFDGDNDWYVGPAAPPSVTGDNSRSIEAWVFNPNFDNEESVFAWGRRGGGDGTNLSFNHGSHATFGAVGHWGADGDIGWSGAQESNIWSHITYTYDATENRTSVYTNGELSTEENHGIPMATHPTDNSGQPLPFVVGNQNENNGTRTNTLSASMSIAKIRVYDEVLSQPEVAARYNADASAFGRTGVASPPLIESFTAAPTTIFDGNTATLSWSVANATSLSIDNNAPAITPADTSTSVSPTTATTYTLTATNADGSVQATTTVNVDPGTPTAVAQTIDVSQDASAPITLTATDPNTTPTLLADHVTSAPSGGTLAGDPPSLTYTPTLGFAGPDSFTFTATDGLTTSAPATVTINVVPPPVAPNAITLSSKAVSQHSLPGNIIAVLASTDFNPADSHTYLLAPGAGADHNALFTITSNQLISAHDFSADPVATTYSVRLRSTDNTGLAFEQAVTITRIDDPLTVLINEINHDSPDNSVRSDFVELHNPATGAIDISAWTLGGGISYTFPAETSIAPGGFLVVAKSPATINTLFGFIPLGPYGGELSSSGDRVILRDNLGNKIDDVDYRAEFPWPVAAAGDGPSMELLNPGLDNDLGSSWRSSTTSPAQTFIAPADTAWRIRKGNSEASTPRADWRTLTFSEDGTWFTGQTPVGYGDNDDNTVLNDMRFGYTTAYLRHTFNIDGTLPGQLRLRLYLDDGAIVWINGHEVKRVNVAGGEDAFNIIATDPAIEPTWFEFTLSAAEAHLVPGQNIVAAMAVNQSIGSSDVSFDLGLSTPAAGDTSPQTLPSPGARNSVYATNPAPNIRQVNHTPQTPISAEPTLITAKITDPQGVADVTLHLQVVAPGNFIPARTPRSTRDLLRNPEAENPENPEFENPANWSSLTMLDDGTAGDLTAGDNIYTAQVPAQDNRTLVRYRISVGDLAGASARAPFPDDPSLNFAYFV